MTTDPRTGAVAAVPPQLLARVRAASLAARPAGRPVPAGPDVPPAEALRRAADSLDALLGSLRPDEWAAPALRGLDVQGLVGHLVGVEEACHGCLAGAPAGADTGRHVESTQWAVREQAGQPPERTRARWRSAVDRTLSLVAGLDAAGLAVEVTLHRVRLPVRGLLVARAFELWAHENDIRLATGRAPSVPDAGTLALMTDLAVAMLPAAARRSGMTGGHRVRVVLTGPGGGAWDVALGDPAPPTPADAPRWAARMVTDAVSFCRLAANRLDPADLLADLAGDPELVRGLLAATAALALD